MKTKTRSMIGSGAGIFILVMTIIMTHQPKALQQLAARHPRVLGESTPLALRQDAGETHIPQPVLQKPVDTAGVAAKSFLVYDAATEQTLVEQDADRSLPIASLTKLMTGYVAYQHTSLRQTATITAQDQVDQSPVLGVKVGDTMLLGDLFNSMLIGSANDAAQSLANYVAAQTNTDFIELMNTTASALGMNNSHFSNPLGFDSDTNYSTAHDLQILVDQVRQYAAFVLVGRYTSYSFTSEQGTTYRVKATNKLITTDKEISAIKTGFTDEAQGAMITQVTHQGHSFIIIVLSSPQRETDTLLLKKAILTSYVWQ